jgi:hypothetical protein
MASSGSCRNHGRWQRFWSRFDPVDEAVAAANACREGLVVDFSRNIAFPANRLGHKAGNKQISSTNFMQAQATQLLSFKQKGRAAKPPGPNCLEYETNQPLAAAATSAAKSLVSLSMPSPKAKRTKPEIFTGAPIVFSASFTACSTVISGLSTKACLSKTTSS